MPYKKTKGEKSKQLIIETAAMLFLQKGYFHTGIAEILKVSKLTKGSFYFYFSSKEELGGEVAIYFRNELCKWFEEKLANASRFQDFIDNIVCDILKQIDEGSYYGCPFTSFATETAVQIPEIQKQCMKAVSMFQDIFSRAKKLDGLSDNIAKQQGAQALAMYEGCLVCYRITQSKSVISSMRDML